MQPADAFESDTTVFDTTVCQAMPPAPLSYKGVVYTLSQFRGKQVDIENKTVIYFNPEFRARGMIDLEIVVHVDGRPVTDWSNLPLRTLTTLVEKRAAFEAWKTSL